MSGGKTININDFIVIESLFSDEIKTGKNLFDDLIKRRTSAQEIGADYFEVNSKQQFIDLMIDIYRAVKNDELKPYLHFEIHGNKEGFEFNNHDFLKWSELAPLIRNINVALKNTLVLSLATCYGAYMFDVLDPTERAPFYMYIGPIKEEKGYDLLNDFSAYFNEILTQFDFNAALEYMVRPETTHRYMVYSSILLFEHLEKAGLMYVDKMKWRKKIWSSVAGTAKAMNRRDSRKKLKELEKERPAAIRQMRAYFLMKDLRE